MKKIATLINVLAFAALFSEYAVAMTPPEPAGTRRFLQNERRSLFSFFFFSAPSSRRPRRRCSDGIVNDFSDDEKRAGALMRAAQDGDRAAYDALLRYVRSTLRPYLARRLPSAEYIEAITDCRLLVLAAPSTLSDAVAVRMITPRPSPM